MSQTYEVGELKSKNKIPKTGFSFWLEPLAKQAKYHQLNRWVFPSLLRKSNQMKIMITKNGENQMLFLSPNLLGWLLLQDLEDKLNRIIPSKLEVAPNALKMLDGVGEWMDGYPLDCYDY